MITHFEYNDDDAKAVREQVEHRALRVMTQLELQHERGEISAIDLRARTNDLERFFFPQLDIYEDDGSYGLCYSYAPSGRSSFTGAEPEKHPIAPAEYDEIRRADDEVALGRKGGRWFVLYEYRLCVVPLPECDDVEFTALLGRYLLRKADKCGLFSTEDGGRFIAPIEYDEITPAGTGYSADGMLLRKGQKYGFYDHRTFVPADYDAIRFPRTKGYVRFYRGEECGFIDAQGRWTQNIDEAYVWSEGEDLMAIDL